MDEDLKLDVRTALADFGDFVERQLARQDDTVDARFFAKNGRRPSSQCSPARTDG
jgi:hypothetical protein